MLICAPLALAVVGFFAFVASLEREEVAIVPHAQGVVALTGGADRISDAVDLVAAGHADRLLITGVNQATTGTQIAKQAPRFRPLSDCCIELGYEALNTVGNALETRRWARAHGITRSLIVVTSNYHMPRALLEMARALPDVKLVPYPVVGDKTRGDIWRDPLMTRAVAYEYLKYVAALARARVQPNLAAADIPAGAPRQAAMAR